MALEPIGEIIKEIKLPPLPPEIQAEIDRSMALSSDERERMLCDDLNKEPGGLIGYDCPTCLNRGGSYVMRGAERVFVQCHCHEIRSSLMRLQNSGLGDMLEEFTFDSFVAENDWQERIKRSAMNYVQDSYGKWFFIGGQVGAGKTHICTAIVGEFLKQGKSARYMLWRDEVVQIKSNVNDDAAYAKLINPLKTVDVLYIDDFLKTPRGDDGKVKPPTPGDINVAFELLNYRYNNRNLVTIISCEHFIDKLNEFDEAVGSRIYQRAKGYTSHVKRDSSRNYRMREV